MRQYTWGEYYEKFYDWAESTQPLRTCFTTWAEKLWAWLACGTA